MSEEAKSLIKKIARSVDRLSPENIRVALAYVQGMSDARRLESEEAKGTDDH